jgi:hypothetical protein
MTHDYKRHGTTTLFTALDVLEGRRFRILNVVDDTSARGWSNTSTTWCASVIQPVCPFGSPTLQTVSSP